MKYAMLYDISYLYQKITIESSFSFSVPIPTSFKTFYYLSSHHISVRNTVAPDLPGRFY